MKRRDFLRATAAGALAAPLLPNLLTNVAKAAEPTARWYKGNLHAHSQWSDGQDLPEVALAEYKKRGYNFFAFTEHNTLQRKDFRFDGKDAKPFDGETSYWKRLATKGVRSNLTEDRVRKARELFGEDSVVTKETAEGTFVRLKTCDELRQQFGDKENFLLMSAFEMTTPWAHLNLINDNKFYDDLPEELSSPQEFDRMIADVNKKREARAGRRQEKDKS
ncbi:MAG: twin-arginine translocation signal domain-containing protein, partial [Thermoguttaceae bacterium]|nr:twin-arginine translocation signal domain-containing protein [Thermoguttaceae bacterium]